MNESKKMLIVEDELLIAKVYVSQINKSQLGQAFSCSNVLDCMKLLKDHQFDLFILDVNLKNGESGIDLAKSIREFSNKHIIFTTGNSNPEIDLMLKSIPNVSVLLKPVNFDYLLRLIKENS